MLNGHLKDTFKNQSFIMEGVIALESNRLVSQF